MAVDQQQASQVSLKAVWIVVAALAALSIGLWARFGPTVFLDMMASAWRFCF